MRGSEGPSSFCKFSWVRLGTRSGVRRRKEKNNLGSVPLAWFIIRAASASPQLHSPVPKSGSLPGPLFLEQSKTLSRKSSLFTSRLEETPLGHLSIYANSSLVSRLRLPFISILSPIIYFPESLLAVSHGLPRNGLPLTQAPLLESPRMVTPANRVQMASLLIFDSTLLGYWESLSSRGFPVGLRTISTGQDETVKS